MSIELKDTQIPSPAGPKTELAPPPTTAARRGAERGPVAGQEARFARAFAQVTAVLMRDPNFRSMRIAELEWLVIPPLLAGQWRLAQASAGSARPGPDSSASAGSLLVPVAAALWARVSPTVDRRLAESLDKPLHLNPAEWRSGDLLWLIAVAGDQRAVPRFLKVLQESEFKDREVKLRARAPDGSVVVKTLQEYAKPTP